MAEKRKRRPKGTGGIYQRADGYWVGTIEAGWDSRGKRRRLYVTGKTKTICTQRLRDREREIARQGIPAEGARRGETVKAYAEGWLKVREGVARPGTFVADRSAVNQWIIPTIGSVKLEQVSAAHVRSITDAVLSAGRKESTAVRAHAVTIMLLKAAQQEGRTIPPGALTVAGPGKNESDREAIPLDHAREILTAARDLPAFSRWLFAFTEAPRPAEALGLTWDCLDLDAGVVDLSWQLKPLSYRVPRDPDSGFRIPRGYEVRRLTGRYHLVRPKTSAGKRRIPLVAPVVTALEEWRDVAPASPYGLVWPTVDGPPTDDKRDRQAWRDLCDAAMVASTAPWHVQRGRETVASVQGRRYDLYEARHTTASLLRASGVSDDVITMIMGHASILSSEAYIHISMDAARRDLASATEVLQLGA
ncbi:MAG: site-specific integrase [Propionibacterium sp.]|nr:site-specific integrase [Propionibacterium sp.]